MNSSLMLPIIPMIKRNWIFLLFAASLVLFLFSRFRDTEKGSNRIRLAAKIFRSGEGWGYDILTNDTVFIHQETIPAIEGRKPFQTKEDAKEISDLVLSKMHQRKLPVINTGELDSCGIER